MPTVPQYNPNQMSVTTPMPVQFDTKKIEPEKPSPLAGVAEKAFGMMQKAVIEVDKARAGQADSESTAVMDKLLTNAKGRTGENAINVGAESLAEYDAWVGERSKSLSKGLQRSLFQSAAMKKRQDLEKVLTDHEANEIERFKDQSFKSRSESRKMDVAMTYRNGENSVVEKINQAKMDIAERAVEKGLGMDWANAETTKMVSDMHSSVISSMIGDGDLMAAKAWKKKYGSLIVEGSSRRFDTAIDNGILRVQSDKKAAELWAMGEAVAYEEASMIQDIDERKEVLSALDDRRVTTARATAAAELKTYNTARAQLLATGKIDPLVYASLSPESQDALSDLKSKRRAGKIDATKPTEYSRYLDMSRDAQETFVNTNLQASRDSGDIDDVQLKTLESIQRSLKSGDTSVINRLKSDANNNAIMEQEWKSSGGRLNLDPTSKAGKNYELFKTRAYEELESESAKGALDIGRKREIIQKLLKGEIYKLKMNPLGEQIGGQSAIPQSFVDMLAKKKVTDPDTIEYYWAAYLQGKK